MDWKGKRVGILGWGVDTQDVEPWLRKMGAEITVLDEAKDKTAFFDLDRYDVLVRSPGVQITRREIVEAEKRGVEITSKTKIFFDECRGKIVGVTGTKGKGTTSTLIFEMLKRAGRQVYLGGNIGKGVFGILDELSEKSWVVLELSSFQLADLKKSPHIAVVLMVTVDHLDWHSSKEDYVEAKSNITRWQNEDDWVVANKEYENSRKIGLLGRGKKVWVSSGDVLLGKSDMGLRGEHNKENVAAAVAVGKLVGVSEEVMLKTVKEFKGLEHRLEEVRQIDGVIYVDDSFSTTPETTIAAVRAFDEPLVLIVGGSEKGSDFTDMGKVIEGAKNVNAVVVVGQMAERIKEALKKAGGRVKIVEGAANMREMVELARGEVGKRGVVLLSPGAASFDMFANYKERGDMFKDAVMELE